MKTLLFVFIVFFLITFCQSNVRRRRQYPSNFNYLEQYSNQYQVYGPGGQGWINNYNNRYPNPNYAWNNNYNWNQGNRRPEWYYNSSKTIQPSILIFFIFSIQFFLFI